MTRIGIITAALLAWSSPVAAQDQAAAVAATLTIQQDSARYTLAVPVSRLVMTIPKGRLKVHRAANTSPRYFFLEDSTQHLQISGWFESSDGFKGIPQLWSDETNTWKQRHLPAPIDVGFVKIGKWDAVVYDVTATIGKDTNIRASWVDAGTWIDMHLSMTGTLSQAELRRRLRDVLQHIAVAQKPA